MSLLKTLKFKFSDFIMHRNVITSPECLCRCKTHCQDAVWSLRRYKFGLRSVSLLLVYFLFRPEPPVEPGTPAHSTVCQTLACFTSTQGWPVWWAGDKKRRQVLQTCQETWLLLGLSFLFILVQGIKVNPKRYELCWCLILKFRALFMKYWLNILTH